MLEYFITIRIPNKHTGNKIITVTTHRYKLIILIIINDCCTVVSLHCSSNLILKSAFVSLSILRPPNYSYPVYSWGWCDGVVRRGYGGASMDRFGLDKISNQAILWKSITKPCRQVLIDSERSEVSLGLYHNISHNKVGQSGKSTQ